MRKFGLLSLVVLFLLGCSASGSPDSLKVIQDQPTRIRGYHYLIYEIQCDHGWDTSLVKAYVYPASFDPKQELKDRCSHQRDDKDDNEADDE